MRDSGLGTEPRVDPSMLPMDDDRSLLRAFRDVTEQTRAVCQPGAPAPLWAASTQRYVEETVSNVLQASPRSELEHAASDGVEDALKTIGLALQQASGTSVSTPPPAAPTSGG